VHILPCWPIKSWVLVGPKPKSALSTGKSRNPHSHKCLMLPLKTCDPFRPHIAHTPCGESNTIHSMTNARLSRTVRFDTWIVWKLCENKFKNILNISLLSFWCVGFAKKIKARKEKDICKLGETLILFLGYPERWNWNWIYNKRHLSGWNFH